MTTAWKGNPLTSQSAPGSDQIHQVGSILCTFHFGKNAHWPGLVSVNEARLLGSLFSGLTHVRGHFSRYPAGCIFKSLPASSDVGSSSPWTRNDLCQPHCAKRKQGLWPVRKRDTCHPFTNTCMEYIPHTEIHQCTGTYIPPHLPKLSAAPEPCLLSPAQAHIQYGTYLRPSFQNWAADCQCKTLLVSRRKKQK